MKKLFCGSQTQTWVAQTWGYSRWLAPISASGHASESFRGNSILAALDSNLVLSGGHALENSTKFFRHLFYSLRYSGHASDSFRWDFISLTLYSHIVISCGYAL